MSSSAYSGYQAMVTDVTVGISSVDSVCRKLNMEAQATELGKLSEKLRSHVFSVGIMGEFKRGKSTVINALLGQEIVPADIVPCSATLNYIRWDTEKRAEIHFKDGTVSTVAVEQLSDYVTKLTEESERNAENVEDAVVYYPTPFCQNGVQIVDTPGLNDDERMTAISENVIPTLDAIIMVIVPQSPFSASEAEFVRSKVMTSDLGRIIFVVNKIDLVDEDERQRILDHIKDKIATSVLDKTARVYGEDSPEYRSAKEKIGSIKLIPVSAKRALKGKMKNSPDMVEESGYKDFEEALSYLLTEERGLLDLIHPINMLMSTGNEAIQTIATRRDALEMSAAEFEQIQRDSIAKIEDTRARKKEEILRLRSKSGTLFYDLLPELKKAYDDVSDDVEGFITAYPLDSLDFKNKSAMEEFTEKISGEINKKIEGSLAISTERLLTKLHESIGRDVDAMNSFGEKFNKDLSDIRVSIAKPALSSVVGGISGALIDTAAIYGTVFLTGMAVPGLGSLISGYKNYGLKGALVGGVSGAAIGTAVALGLLATPVVGIPFAIIMGAASTFGGKAVTRFVFGKAKGESVPPAEQVRAQLLDAARENMNELRKSEALENWFRTTCDDLYSSVADSIDSEWENSLRTLEETLTQIHVDLEMNAENRKNTEKELESYAQVIREVIENIQPLREKLNSALNKA